ncbi:hypothetical protein HCH_01547 [Hahella chejuensis KCTC 2396]|uniref:DUF4124 domain-containing protein n=1 Tax=Hahella chejuensis (strain KCTC 2396) TaxID=349521 RepID=Q2SLS0_HAHCH|nr:DUF4124 domain-containing protein [Hahella chejuensis]ABC28404.1 hypothetical protein HCH_01547 [Hahella chejuensis KCTC 2396]
MKRWLLQLLVVVALVPAVWFISTPDQRRTYLTLLNLPQDPSWLHEGNLLALLGSAPQRPPEAEPFTETSSTPDAPASSAMSSQEAAPNVLSALRQMAHSALPQTLCGKTATRDIRDVETPQIYKWTDANGRVHFSDSAQNKSAQFVGESYASQKKYFDFKLTSKGMPRNGLVEDKIRAAAQQVYTQLEAYLAPERRRQIILNLELYGDRAEYEALRKKVFPGFNAAAFFSHGANTIYMVNEDQLETTVAIAKHEVVHAVLAGLVGPMPTWLNEGMAEYLEHGGLPYKALPIDLSENAINQLLATKHQDFYNASAESNYMASHKLVAYLNSSGEGRRVIADIFNDLAEAPCSQVDSLGAVTSAMGDVGHLAKLL